MKKLNNVKCQAINTHNTPELEASKLLKMCKIIIINYIDIY